MLEGTHAPGADEAALAGWLRAHGVPAHLWSVGALAALLAELRAGDGTLVLSEEGTATRYVRAVVIEITTVRNGAVRRLVEGTVHGRAWAPRRARHSLGEKVRRGETYRQAAIRGLREELGITKRVRFRGLGPVPAEPRSHWAFPGLVSTYSVRGYSLELPADLYRRKYVQLKQLNDGTTRVVEFRWERI